MNTESGYTKIESIEELSFADRHTNSILLENYIIDFEFSFWFLDSKEINLLHFDNCIFKKGINLNEASFLGGVHFLNVEIHGNANFKNAEFKTTNENIVFDIRRLGGTIQFDDSVFYDLLEFDIHTFNNNSVVSLTNSELKKGGLFKCIDLLHDFLHGELVFNFRDAKIKKTININSRTDIKLILNDAQIEKSLVLFGNYKYISTIGTNLLGQLIVEQFYLSKGPRNTFSFLKNHLISSNNKIDALDFSRREMTSYFWDLIPFMILLKRKRRRKQQKRTKTDLKKKMFLTLVKHFYSAIKGVFFFLKPDFIILLLSLISNNHGTSWLRGVLFTFFIGVFFFLLFNYNLEQPLFDIGWNGLNSFKEAVSVSFPYFRKFLFVGHSWEFMIKYKPNNWALFYDFVGRIFIGFGYYQTIIAFRKYGRT